MNTTIATIEERLYNAALAEMSATLDTAVESFAKVFAPYVGFRVKGEETSNAQSRAFTEALADAFSEAVRLHTSYYAGYTTKLTVEKFAPILDRHLPVEVKSAIRSVAAEAFLKKIEEIGTIADEALATAQNSTGSN